MRPINSTQFRPEKSLIFFALLFISPAIHADAQTTDQTEEPLPTIKFFERFDSKRDVASRYLTDFANWIDNFFADDRIYDEEQGSYIKLNLLQTYFEDSKPLYDAQIKGKLDIPKTQKRLQLFIESIDSDEDDTQQTSINETVDKQEQSIGLRFFQPDTKLWKIITIAGVRFRSGLDPFARIRFRRLIDKGQWTFRITENIFWYRSDGAGETTRLDIDHPLTKKLLFRSTSQATWRNINDYFDLGQDFILFQNINKRKSLAYQAGVRGISDKRTYTTDYFYLVHYRQQIHNKWLFLDIIPSINHPRENDYKPIRSLTINFEIVFDAK